MSTDLSPVLAATARWLTRSYPSSGGAFDRVLAEAQAQQAVAVTENGAGIPAEFRRLTEPGARERAATPPAAASRPAGSGRGVAS